MFDKDEIKQLKDIFATKDDLKSLATKEDLKREISDAVDGLAVMVNGAFNENEKRMDKGFKMVREEFKIVNDKLDKKLEKAEGIKVIKEALAIE